VKLTGPVPVFVTVTFCAGLVEFTVCEANVSDVGDTVTVAGPFTPVPVNVTVWGLPDALSVKVIAPVRVPAAVGLNAIWKVQGVPSTAMPGHCAVVAPVKSPVVTILVNVMATPPLLATSTICVALVVPTVWLANVNEVGEMEIAPACVPPVPLKVTFCGLPVALSATFNVAVRVPLALGVNNTLIWQYSPPASVPVGLHIIPELGKGTPKSLAFVPVTVKPAKVTVVVPLFTTVTLIGELVVPTFCEGKVKLGGVTVTEPDELALNVAVTVWFWLITTVQVPLVFVQAPLQPAKVEPFVVVAVSTTEVPSVKSAAQVVPQVMPAGALETEPVPAPASVTVSEAAPVPVNATVCVLFVTGALSVSVSVPVSAPKDAGENVIESAHCAPTATVVPQVFPLRAKAPLSEVTVTSEIASGASPELVSITISGPLVELIA
jgi:hypothetical protein